MLKTYAINPYCHIIVMQFIEKLIAIAIAIALNSEYDKLMPTNNIVSDGHFLLLKSCVVSTIVIAVLIV